MFWKRRKSALDFGKIKENRLHVSVRKKIEHCSGLNNSSTNIAWWKFSSRCVVNLYSALSGTSGWWELSCNYRLTLCECQGRVSPSSWHEFHLCMSNVHSFGPEVRNHASWDSEQSARIIQRFTTKTGRWAATRDHLFLIQAEVCFGCCGRAIVFAHITRFLQDHVQTTWPICQPRYEAPVSRDLVFACKSGLISLCCGQNKNSFVWRWTFSRILFRSNTFFELSFQSLRMRLYIVFRIRGWWFWTQSAVVALCPMIAWFGQGKRCMDGQRQSPCRK